MNPAGKKSQLPVSSGQGLALEIGPGTPLISFLLSYGINGPTMKRMIVILAVLVGIVLAGCAGGKRTPVVSPPPAALTPEPSATLAASPATPYPAAVPTQAASPAFSAYPYPAQASSEAQASLIQPGAYPTPGQEATNAPVVQGSNPTVTSPYPAPGGIASPAPVQTVSQAASANITPTAYPAPLSTQAPAPTLRPTRDVIKELHATDPKTVQLASGKVQLVEFFAFW